MGRNFSFLKDAIIIKEDYTNTITYTDDTDGEMNPIYKSTSIKTNEFLNRITNKFSQTPNDYIYPSNTRFVKKFNDLELFVIEWQPSIRTIKVEKDMFLEYSEVKNLIDPNDYNDENNIHLFRLSFPYIVWVVCLNRKTSRKHMKLYFRLAPLSSLYDSLILPPLLNIRKGRRKTAQSICLGPTDGYNENSDVMGIEDLTSLFFTNTFNTDYPECYNSYREYEDSTFSNYFMWQYKTKKNPLFIFRDNWLPSDVNLKNEIDNMFKMSFRDEASPQTQTVKEQLNSLITSTETEVIPYKSKDGKGSIIKTNDVFEEVTVRNNIISIGDDLRVNDRICYLNSIINNNEEMETKFEIEYEDTSEIDVITLNDKIRDDISKYFDETKNRLTRLEFIEINNQKIKPGDFILDKNLTKSSFLKVEDIIKNRDDFIEFRLQGKRRIVNNNFEKFSYHKLCEILGGKIRKGTKLIKRSSSPPPAERKSIIPYDIRKNKTLEVKRIRTRDEILSIETENRQIVDFNKFKVVDSQNINSINSSTVRSGLFLINSSESINNGYWEYCKSENCLFSGNISFKKENYLNVAKAIKDIFNENELFIKGTDFDINFKIGDEVVVSNWDDIESMLKIKRIIGFKLVKYDMYGYGENVITEINENNSINDFTDEQLNETKYIQIMTDDDERIESFDYVDFNNHYGFIFMPKIRKITRSYNDFNVGDYVKSTIPKIEGFPKKDINKIIAFIDDAECDYPLALMSNTWTIRANDLIKYFKKIESNDNGLAVVRPPKINRKRLDMVLFNHERRRGYYMVEIHDIYNIFVIHKNSLYFKRTDLNKKPFGFLNPKFDTLVDDEIDSQLGIIYYPNLMNWFNKREVDNV